MFSTKAMSRLAKEVVLSDRLVFYEVFEEVGGEGEEDKWNGIMEVLITII